MNEFQKQPEAIVSYGEYKTICAAVMRDSSHPFRDHLKCFLGPFNESLRGNESKIEVHEIVVSDMLSRKALEAWGKSPRFSVFKSEISIIPIIIVTHHMTNNNEASVSLAPTLPRQIPGSRLNIPIMTCDCSWEELNHEPFWNLVHELTHILQWLFRNDKKESQPNSFMKVDTEEWMIGDEAEVQHIMTSCAENYVVAVSSLADQLSGTIWDLHELDQNYMRRYLVSVCAPYPCFTETHINKLMTMLEPVRQKAMVPRHNRRIMEDIISSVCLSKKIAREFVSMDDLCAAFIAAGDAAGNPEEASRLYDYHEEYYNSKHEYRWAAETEARGLPDASGRLGGPMVLNIRGVRVAIGEHKNKFSAG